MPLLDYNDPAIWAETYDVNRDDGQPGRVGYVLAGKRHLISRDIAPEIIAELGLNDTHRILILGAGFGWLANDIAIMSGAVVAAVDTSTYIQDNKVANAEGVEILNADVSAGSGRAQVRQALGITGNNKATHAITENVITVLDDAENTQLSSFLHNMADIVVHWTAERYDDKLAKGFQDPRYNWKHFPDWKLLLPNDLFISARTNTLV